MRAIAHALVLAALTACGGPPPPEEVSVPWTSGDDAPLEADEGGEP